MMSHYPDGDKPIRLFTAYRCPLCSRQYNVWNSKGETLEDVYRLHRMNCRVLQQQTGGDICKHLGRVTGDSVELGGCGGGEVALFHCALHKICLPYTSKSKMRRAKSQLPFCAGCEDYNAIPFKHSDLCGEEVKRRVTDKMQESLDPDPAHTASSTPPESDSSAE